MSNGHTDGIDLYDGELHFLTSRNGMEIFERWHQSGGFWELYQGESLETFIGSALDDGSGTKLAKAWLDQHAGVAAPPR